MVIKAKTATTKKVKKPAAKKRSVVEVDAPQVESLASVAEKATSKSKAKTTSHAKKISVVPTVTTEKVLIAVDVDRSGTAAVAKYAGLFFILIGACASSLALSGLYVEGVDLAYKNIQPTQPHVRGVGATQDLPGVGNTASLTTALPQAQNATDVSLETLRDDARISLSSSTDARRTVSITAPEAEHVRLFVTSNSILSERYIQHAFFSTSTTWTAILDDQHIPSGRYQLFARVETAYGSYDTDSVSLVVTRDMATSTISEEMKMNDEIITTKIGEAANEFDTREPQKNIVDELGSLFVAQETNAATTSTSTSNLSVDINDRLLSFRASLTTHLEALRNAVRVGDDTQRSRITSSIDPDREALKQEIAAIVAKRGTIASNDVLVIFNEKVAQFVSELFSREQKKQVFIKEKVGSESFGDTDFDGISDYDERVLYATNYLSADTDSDGFNDGAEIAAGYDALNADSESLVRFESPKANSYQPTDIPRIITFESIEATDHEPAKTVLGGTAAPRSFVSLYLFSNAFTTWIRADEHGNWSFDISPLNLDVGSHEAYVAEMSNDGSLLAVSKPFSFVRTATGYSSFKAFRLGSQDGSASPMPFSDSLLMLVYALVVTTLGLILMMIGAHLTHHERRAVHTPKPV